jgi:phosphatidylserine decarboxylase
LGGTDHVAQKRLYHITIYLSPGDYHRIHSPAEWNITRRKHFPGALLPVNPIAVKFVRGLFAMNERVVLEGQWQGASATDKYFALTAVGALNVGSVALNFDSDVQTNYHHSMSKSAVDYFIKPNCTIDMARPDLDKTMSNPYGSGTTYDRTYPNGIVMERGEELGRFKLGSTVVLVFESDSDINFSVKPGQKVKMGQKIIQ